MQNPTWGEERSSGPRRGRWSQAEQERLKELYGLREDKAIARELNRSVASVRKMAESVFDQEPMRIGPWSEEERHALKRYLGATSEETIARVMRRELSEVRQAIEELGAIQSEGPWGQEELIDLKRLYGTRTDEHLALIFGRSIESVKKEADVLCLSKDKAFLRKLSGGKKATRMPRWKASELELLRELYSTHSNLSIAQRLNRSVKSVVSKAHNMGLKKDPTRLREMGRENVSLRYKREDPET